MKTNKALSKQTLVTGCYPRKYPDITLTGYHYLNKFEEVSNFKTKLDYVKKNHSITLIQKCHFVNFFMKINDCSSLLKGDFRIMPRSHLHIYPVAQTNRTVDTVDFQDFALINSYIVSPCWIEHLSSL